MHRLLVVRSRVVLAAAFAVAGVVSFGVTQHEQASVGAAQDVLLPAHSVGHPGDLPDIVIETAAGKQTRLSASNGQVRLAAMFYSHCPGVCPMTIETLKGVEQQLSDAQRARLGVVLLSLDPTHDSPNAMRALAAEHGLSSPRWLIGRTSSEDTASFARALRIHYRPLSDGSIDHSSALVLLDSGGRVIARADDGEASSVFVNAVGQALNRDGAR